MASTDPPTFSSTLVSAQLCKPWTEHAVMQEVQNQDPALYEGIAGVQINNQGRIIEFLIKCPNIRATLLANGLKFGAETIMFRPYNGVFALLKNIPLEVTRDGVLQLVQSLNWQIDGPSPASRISPQLNILRDGRGILPGRWTCMLDKFPVVPRNADGTKKFFTTAYGGRKISYNIAFHRFPKERELQADPRNYARTPIHEQKSPAGPQSVSDVRNTSDENPDRSSCFINNNSSDRSTNLPNKTSEGPSSSSKDKVDVGRHQGGEESSSAQ